MAFLVGETEICAVCGQEIVSGSPCVPTCIKVRTRGFTPRLDAPTQTVYMCQPCALFRAFHPEPPEGIFNRAVFVALRDLFRMDPALGYVAIEQMNKEWTDATRQKILNQVVSRPHVLTAGEILPPDRELKAAAVAI